VRVNELAESGLTLVESRDLKRLAGTMIPASEGYSVPGADNETNFDHLVRSLGRDKLPVKAALATR
jgi:hypothetical protein